MDKKGFELTISTVVIIVIAIALLIGLFVFLNKGFGWFKAGTKPFANSVEVTAIRESCNFACQAQDSLTFCCEEYSLRGNSTSCRDSRLGVRCSINCEDVDCGAPA